MDWGSIGYELAGKFEHGRAAKEFLEQNAVDVVLTDICMPYMDGIALSEYIYKNMPQVKVIIFSGFDDFEYAQKAIHYQVEEYLLKPVTAEDLSKLLIKQKMKMDEEQRARENSRKLSRTLHKNKIYLYSQALQKLFCGSSPAQECIKELEECGIELFPDSFYPVILRLNESGEQSALFQFVAYNIVQELVHKQGLGWAGLGYECDIFICFCNKGFGGEKLQERCGHAYPASALRCGPPCRWSLSFPLESVSHRLRRSALPVGGQWSISDIAIRRMRI